MKYKEALIECKKEINKSTKELKSLENIIKDLNLKYKIISKEKKEFVELKKELEKRIKRGKSNGKDF